MNGPAITDTEERYTQFKKADYLKHIQKCTCVHKGAIYVFVVIGFFIVLMWRKFTGQFKVPIKDIKAQLFIFQ